MKLKTCSLCLLLILPLIAKAEDSLPSSFTSHYKLLRDGTTIGEMTRSLEKQEDQYVFRSDSKTTGLVALFYKDNRQEWTRWRMQSDHFIPLQYYFNRQKEKKDRLVKIDFDWDSRQITTDVNGSIWKMATENNIYDKLLYQIAIMRDLKAGKPITEFRVADGGKIKTYSFKNLGEEVIKTPIGDFKAVKLERRKSNEDSKKRVIFWCSEALDYAPVKVENIDKKGKVITALITHYSN